MATSETLRKPTYHPLLREVLKRNSGISYTPPGGIEVAQAQRKPQAPPKKI